MRRSLIRKRADHAPTLQSNSKMNIHKTEFIKSAAASQDLIKDGLPQIVFSGKSNVGKSSVINKLLNHKNFARVSSTPGKTIHINYFLIDKTAYFVDLPGYGYAKVAKKERNRWSALMENYFSGAAHISLGIMIVDARHKPTGDDVIMAHWFELTQSPIVIVANKIDKVKKSEIDSNIALIKETLGFSKDRLIIQFSALTGTGRELLLTEIENAVGFWKNPIQII